MGLFAILFVIGYNINKNIHRIPAMQCDDHKTSLDYGPRLRQSFQVIQRLDWPS